MAKSVRTLIRWGLVYGHGHGPYLAGYSPANGTVVSTPLVKFDPAAGTALTSSGRPYALWDGSDPDYAVAVARHVWSQVFDLTGADIHGLTPDEAVALIRKSGNVLFNYTAEEKAVIAKRYGVTRGMIDDDDDGFEPSRSDLIVPDPEDGEDDAPGRKS